MQTLLGSLACWALLLTFCPGSDAAPPPGSEQLARPVVLVIDVDHKKGIAISDVGCYFSRAKVVVAASAVDPPMSIEVTRRQAGDYNDWVFKVKYGPGIELDPGFLSKPPDFAPDMTRYAGTVNKTGTQIPEMTYLRNSQIFDPATGQGLAIDVWRSNPYITLGGEALWYGYEGPLIFVRSLLSQPNFFPPGWELDDYTSTFLKNGITYWQLQRQVNIRQYLPVVFADLALPGGEWERRIFTFNTERAPSSPPEPPTLVSQRVIDSTDATF